MYTNVYTSIIDSTVYAGIDEGEEEIERLSIFSSRLQEVIAYNLLSIGR